MDPGDYVTIAIVASAAVYLATTRGTPGPRYGQPLPPTKYGDNVRLKRRTDPVWKDRGTL